MMWTKSYIRLRIILKTNIDGRQFPCRWAMQLIVRGATHNFAYLVRGPWWFTLLVRPCVTRPRWVDQMCLLVYIKGTIRGFSRTYPSSHWVRDKWSTFRWRICKRIFLNWNVRISIKISLKLVPGSPTNNIPDNGLVLNRRQAIIWTNDS